MPPTTPTRDLLATVKIRINLIIRAPYFLLSIQNKLYVTLNSGMQAPSCSLTQPSVLLPTATQIPRNTGPFSTPLHTSYVSIQWRTVLSISSHHKILNKQNHIRELRNINAA